MSRRGPHKVANRLRRDLAGGRRNRLIEDGESIAHRAIARFREERKSILIGFDFFPRHQITKLANDVIELHRTKTEVLATRADRLRNVLGLRGGEHEDDVIRRLLQRLEQRVERGVGNLVGFVENVNLETIARGTVASSLAQLADFVDAAVGGGVDLDDVYGIAGTNFGAGFADATGLGDGMIFFRK